MQEIKEDPYNFESVFSNIYWTSVYYVVYTTGGQVMNIDNSNKSRAGSLSNSSVNDQLEYLKSKSIITDYETKKFGYPGGRKDQFKCDFIIKLPSGDEWILYSAASLTSDRLKTKQWDAENIKKINSNVKKAYVLCPDDSKGRSDILRFRDYIREGKDTSFIDDILFHSEFINLIENLRLGSSLGGSRAAKKGVNFESLLVKIFEDSQNFQKWQGNSLAAGFQYPTFKAIMDKIQLNPTDVVKMKADDNIPELPTYVYKDGSTKKGGRPKTDVALDVEFLDNHTETYTFSCKNTTKDDITVFQFPPKYCVEILDIKENDTETLLNEYVASGGPTNMPSDRAYLLTQRLSAYVDSFNRWVLHGTERDGSTPRQRADYIIIRDQRSDKEEIYIETIDECIQSQAALSRGHFGTIFGWTVTSSKKKKDGTKGEIYPVMRIHID